MDHVLRLISTSPWSDHLVLRGSLLLQAWLGDAARDPGDIDFTVTPHTKLITEPWAAELFADLVRIVRENPHVGSERNVEIIPHEVATDDIWTYDRAPGKRVVFPWKVDGLPGGFVQCDVVFGEEIDPPPTRTLIPARRGPGSTVLAASREQSLAWKILWLQTDQYAQGKDLYDAALLAEQTKLPLALLERTLRSDPDHRMSEPIDANLPLTWEIDWDNFKLEHPHVPGDAQAWKQRLAEALRRSFV
jgi:hypothetical protein